MKNHIGSTAVIIIGLLLFASSVGSNIAAGVVTGPLMIAGAFLYRSAKKRRLGEVSNSWIRLFLELVLLAAITAFVVLQNNLSALIVKDPITNFVLPIFIWFAYLYMAYQAWRKRKSS